ncbi:AzlD domain-containing protein [Clostridium sp. AM58-1XD]|uniref:AzlD domain-containing protein n=1 Tax=Clostridium sp. AM58-1XD TaxID=2292307 RepID=UPI000E531C53|nr:AzlD domain-containing protein [Clostridium sp. AM58-1XD]RGZ00671.1 AzlD domain-containing protein [Clostridium sp. AM58-1XD]
MSLTYILICVAIMAGTTYLIRVLPMVIFKKKIKNIFIQSFLFYVPYAVLSAMTFPAIFSATGSKISAAAGCAVAVVLAYFNRGLLTVAVGASLAAWIVQAVGL